MSADDISPPLIDTTQTRPRSAEKLMLDTQTPRKEATATRNSPRPFNKEQFAVSLERAARKAGSGMGLVLQGRELPVMKSIDKDSQQLKSCLRAAGAPIALENTPYLETHPGVRHAIVHGKQAREDHKQMEELQRRTKERRRKAEQMLMEKRPTGELQLPATPQPRPFDLSDRQVTFHEYVNIRKKFGEHRAAVSTVSRSRQKSSALSLWRGNLCEAHYRTPSPLLRNSYKASFLSYSLAPRYLPAKGEMEQYM